MPIYYDASADAVFRPHTTQFPPQFTDEKRRAVWALEACRLAYWPAEDSEAERRQLGVPPSGGDDRDRALRPLLARAPAPRP